VQVFVRVFAILVTARHLHPHEDFMGMDFLDGTSLVRSVDIDGVAGFQHVLLLFACLPGFSRRGAKTLERCIDFVVRAQNSLPRLKSFGMR
jgi:hypothetical protein